MLTIAIATLALGRTWAGGPGGSIAPRNATRRGYCAFTNSDDGEGCSYANKGSWTISTGLSIDAARTECRARCQACKRCNFISFSRKAHDCSWFHSCDLAALHQQPTGFRTEAVRGDGVNGVVTPGGTPGRRGRISARGRVGKLAAKCERFETSIRDVVEQHIRDQPQSWKNDPQWHDLVLGHAREMALEEPRASSVCDCWPCDTPPTLQSGAELRALRRSRGAFVYLTTAKRRASLWASIDALYTHHQHPFGRQDVLIFHNGDFDAADEAFEQKTLGRPEVHFIHLREGGRHWHLPFLDPSLAEGWVAGREFGVGYRHMCRWWGVLFAELLLEMGYEYAARLDDDSRLLSTPERSLFERLDADGADFGYRVDAIEMCCNPAFRERMVDEYLRHPASPNATFLHECCLRATDGRYNHLGYYNNFFVVRLSLYARPDVKAFLSFVDWTLGWYLLRENDLAVQSLLVQLFVPRERVLRYNDFSYLHSSGLSGNYLAAPGAHLDTGREEAKEKGLAHCGYGALAVAPSDVRRQVHWGWVGAMVQWPWQGMSSFWLHAGDDAAGDDLVVTCHEGAAQKINRLAAPLYRAAHQAKAYGSAAPVRAAAAAAAAAAAPEPRARAPRARRSPGGGGAGGAARGMLLCSASAVAPGGADALLDARTASPLVDRTISPSALDALEAAPELYEDNRTLREGRGARDDARMMRLLLEMYARPRRGGCRPPWTTLGRGFDARRGHAKAAAPAPPLRVIEAGAAECGVGCSVAFYVKPLLMALALGSRFSAPRSSFASADVCGDAAGKLGCFFERFAPACDDEQASGGDGGGGGGAPTRVETQVVKQVDFETMQEWGAKKRRLDEHLPQLARRGWFWVVSQLLAFITRPSARLRRVLQRAEARIELDALRHRPVLGLHVRRGDACTDDPIQRRQKGRDCASLSEYMPHVRRLVQRHGYRTIFLATDSEDVVREARAKYPEYTWLVQERDMRRYAIFNTSGITIEPVLWGQGAFQRTSEQGKRLGFSPAGEFDEFMVDTYLLAKTDGLVGNFANNMDRIAYALMTAYATEGGTCLKPYASLTGHWCNDFQVQSGKTNDGRSFWC